MIFDLILCAAVFVICREITERRLRIKSTKIKFLEAMKNTENNHLFIFLATPKKEVI